MQKKLLTLAVAGALAAPGLALAQSSVQVYGMVNMSFNHVKFGQGTAASAGGVTKWDVASHATNYGLKGRENVGGGLTAWFQIEQNAPIERSNANVHTPASRNSALGLQGRHGNIFIGQWTTPWANLDGLWSVGTAGGWGPVTSVIGRRETTGSAPNPNCGNLTLATALPATVCNTIEGGGGVGHPFWRRASQSVTYQSPVFSGAQINVLYQTNHGKSGSGAGTPNANPSMWSSSITWAGMGGKARIGLAMDRHKEFTTIGMTDTGWAIKGGYNFGMAHVGAAIERMTYKIAGGGVKAKQWAVAVSVPVASGSIKGSYSKQSALNGGGYAGDDTGAKQWNLGYEHPLSKRTVLAFGYAKIDNEAAAAVVWTGLPPSANGGGLGNNLGADIQVWTLNMRHFF